MSWNLIECNGMYNLMKCILESNGMQNGIYMNVYWNVMDSNVMSTLSHFSNMQLGRTVPPRAGQVEKVPLLHEDLQRASSSLQLWVSRLISRPKLLE